MDVIVRDDPDALDAVAEDWRALWLLDPGATAFHSPEYARAYGAAFGHEARVFSIEMRRAGALVGHVPVAVADGVLRFLGDALVSDYLGPVARPEDVEEVAAALLGAIPDIEGWERVLLQGLAADTVWPEVLSRAAKGAGMVVQESQQDVCPRVPIPGSYEDYLASLDGKLRHEIRRKARKLEREAGPYTIRSSTHASFAEDLHVFFELHRSSEGPKGRFLHWGMEGMFNLLARRFDEAGWLRLLWLEVDGRALAGVFGFAAKDVFSVYNSVYDQQARALSPGMVLMAEAIRLAAEEGCGVFDLLRGAEPYKYRFGAVDVPLIQLELSRGAPGQGPGLG